MSAQTYDGDSEKVFTATGDAIIRVAPDQVVLRLGVESRGEDLAATKEENTLVRQRAVAYCKEQGIPEKYIQIDYVRIDPHYTPGSNVAVNYYSIVQSMSVVVSDLSQYESLLTELLNIGINRVDNIDFRTTKLKENRFKVRKMAIEAAREKAVFLTEQVGIELAEVINISETAANPTSSFGRSNYANLSQNVFQSSDSEPAGDALSVGMLSLKATVTLTYRIKE